MVRWICGVRLEQQNRTQVLLDKLGIVSVEDELCWSRLKYYGHIQRMNDNIWPKRVDNFIITGSLPRGRPQLRLCDAIKKDLTVLDCRKNLPWIGQSGEQLSSLVEHRNKECDPSEMYKHVNRWKKKKKKKNMIQNLTLYILYFSLGI